MIVVIQVETRVIQPDSVVEQHPFHLCRKATSVANTPPQIWRRASELDYRIRQSGETTWWWALLMSEGQPIRCLISRSPTTSTNFWWFCFDRALVSPSAAISFVGTHCTMKLPFWTSWRSQNWWISTCRSFVDTVGVSFVTIRTDCWLSQLMMTSCSGSNLMALKIRTICSTSPPTCERARSSASVVDLVTAFCLVACHAIGPLNKLIKKPCKL